MSEQRQEVRIPVEKLPSSLQNVLFSTGLFDEHEANTVNASKDGMSFATTGVPKKDIAQGQKVTITILPQNYKLKSKVIYAFKTGENEIKFGVQFTNNHSLELYYELLNTDF